jgi:hypothetical protein
MQASMNMAQTMKTTTGVMGQMNKQMNPQVYCDLEISCSNSLFI